MPQHFLREKIFTLSERIWKFNLAEYMLQLNNPRRYLIINFWSGVSRGMGVILGATLLAGLVIIMLQRLVLLNLPLIGSCIAEVVRFVLNQL